MKATILVCLMVMIGFSLPAQDQVRLQDHLMLKDGTVLQVHDQDQIRLRDKIMLLDGSSVNPDGSYVTASGIQLRLRDGECLDMDGNWYMSQQQFRQQLQLRTRASEQLHYVMQDGKVLLVQNQTRTQLREQARLQDGGYINPDGSFKLKEQEQMRLRNGECLDPEGNYYGSEAQFRNNARWMVQAMESEHFAYSNGKMFQVKNGVQTQLNRQFQLQNGTVIFPDGSVQLKDRDRDRDRLRLHDGECLDAEGNIYASQNQFMEQAQLRLRAMNQEYFVMEGGQLFQVRNQQRLQVREKLMLHDGLVINPDGTYQLQNRQQARLNNGECLDPEGNRYRTQEQYQNQIQQKYQAMAEPHFSFENGAVFRNQNQIRSQVKESWKLQNGVVVNPDGTFQLRNGTKTKMKNGEVLDWEGKRYENQDRFREKMELRVRERMEIRDREMIERKRVGEAGKRTGI